MPKTKRKKVSLAIDFVFLALKPKREKGLEVLLLKRSKDPHKDEWSLPGAFVHLDEDKNLPKAIDRILKEKLKIHRYIGKQDWQNQQLGCFYSMERDKRGVATVVYWGLISNVKKFNSVDREDLKFSPVDNYKNLGGNEKLPFDHTEILKEAIEHLSETIERKSTAIKFFEKELTTSDLRLAYETVWQYAEEDFEVDDKNFTQFLKKQFQAFSLKETDAILNKQTAFSQDLQKGRPARVWEIDLDVLEDKKLKYPLPRKPRRSKPKKS